MNDRPRGGGLSAEPAQVAGWAGREGLTRWSAHVLFWLVYFAIRTLAASSSPPDEFMEFPFLMNRVLVVFGYFLLTTILLALVLGPLSDRSALTRNLVLLLGGLAVAPITRAGELYFPWLLAHVPLREFPFLAYMFQYGWVLPLWALMQALLAYHFHTLAQARAITRAQLLAQDAQLRMLHYQINPHFLFNTLNAISTLVLDKRTDAAENMLLRLAGFLRYSLDRQPTELAVLSAELEAQRKYLEIEQTRFGEKLSVKFDIEPGMENARLPSLILQPILENAIKYAITPNPDGGRIDVRAYREKGALHICVEDDGPGLQPEPARRRRGVGLANARERLALIYGDRAGLTAKNREPHGCRIDIWLPFEEERVARTIAPIAG